MDDLLHGLFEAAHGEAGASVVKNPADLWDNLGMRVLKVL